MKTLRLCGSLLLAGAFGVRAEDLSCDLRGYSASPGLQAEPKDGRLQVVWDGEADESFRAIFAIAKQQPTIHELAVRTAGGPWRTLAEDVAPNIQVVSGRRRLSNQNMAPLAKLGVKLTDEVIDREKWNVLWDAPLEVPGVFGVNLGLPRLPSEIRRASSTFATVSCEVVTNGGRLEITFPGLSLGIFSGSLRYTVYRGSNLLRQEAIARTMEPSVAYKYNAGLSGFALQETDRVVWRDVASEPQEYAFGGSVNDGPVALRARNRLAVLERAGGSIGFFPPPHKFFFAREVDLNLGYVYYMKEGEASFGIGVRQAEREEMYPPYGFSDELWERRVSHSRGIAKGNFALYNAPPGTWQHMAAYFYLSGRGAPAAMAEALRFTHDDHYVPLPGFKVSVGHFHTHFSEQVADAGTLDLQPPWIPAFRGLGINVVFLSDFHGDGHLNDPGPIRVKEQAGYFQACGRHSDKDFLLVPAEEPSTNFGGHYTMAFPHPVYWTHVRQPGQPFKEQSPAYGTVYHVGSAPEEMAMLREQGGDVWQSHPRTKGSTGYPDAIKDTEPFRSTFFLGGSFQSLPVDQSQSRLGERCFGVLDDMNNWEGPTHLKYLIAEGDTYTKAPEDDIYGALTVNYLKLDRVPRFAAGWQPVLDSLQEGNFFVTTGEVLIPLSGVTGSGDDRTFEATVSWTFPLEFVEVVWGDGQKVDRKIVAATELPAFGERTFRISFPAAGKKWVRFAAWDSAGDGAFTEPVRLQQ